MPLAFWGWRHFCVHKYACVGIYVNNSNNAAVKF